MDADIRNFDPKYLKPLYQAFQAAWEDTPTHFTLPYEHFKNRLNHKLHVNPDYSILYFNHDKIIGFIVNTLNTYKGKLCLYNGGTGVIPEARGMGITEKMYANVIEKMRKDQIDRAVLEVIVSNQIAIHIYEKIGFEITQIFKCLACREPMVSSHSFQVNLVKTPKKTYHDFWDIEPSFLDQSQQIVHNQDQETILEVWLHEKMVGYVIFQSHLGRISQIAVHPDYRNRGIGSALLQEVKQRSLNYPLTIMNIPSDASPFISFLEKNGFVNEIDQYEMELII